MFVRICWSNYVCARMLVQLCLCAYVGSSWNKRSQGEEQFNRNEALYQGWAKFSLEEPRAEM